MSEAEVLKAKPIKTEQVLLENEKVETTIVIEESQNNNDNLDKTHETNTKNRLQNDTVPNVVLEDVVETARIEVENTELHNARKSRKITHWIQYNRAYSQGQGQDQPDRPHQNFGRYGPYGGNYDAGTPMYYEPQSRNPFIKLVFAILLVMLTTTGCYLFVVLITVILMGMNYVMICSTCSRVPPCNFVTLFIVFDFTAWYLYIVAIIVVFTVVSLMVSIAMLVMNVRYKPLQIVMLFIAAIINVVVLIMELQMILGGRSIEMGENDYALGAYLLYNSIINLFLNIVQIMGLMDE
ncbi:unnamed protein product, partial [Brenthis ino]